MNAIILNSINISTARRQGRAQLEFWTTPGPLSFLIYAFLMVDRMTKKSD